MKFYICVNSCRHPPIFDLIWKFMSSTNVFGAKRETKTFFLGIRVVFDFLFVRFVHELQWGLEWTSYSLMVILHLREQLPSSTTVDATNVTFLCSLLHGRITSTDPDDIGDASVVSWVEMLDGMTSLDRCDDFFCDLLCFVPEVFFSRTSKSC